MYYVCTRKTNIAQRAQQYKGSPTTGGELHLTAAVAHQKTNDALISNLSSSDNESDDHQEELSLK